MRLTNDDANCTFKVFTNGSRCGTLPSMPTALMTYVNTDMTSTSGTQTQWADLNARQLLLTCAT